MSSVGVQLPSWIHGSQERALTCLTPSAPAVGARRGIVRGLADTPLAPDDPKLFHVAAQTADSEPLFGRSCIGQNGGCGLTREIARAGAIGEAIERYAAAAYDESALISATYRELEDRGIEALPPESIPLYSERQYERPGFPYERFHADTCVRWTWGTSLV